MSLRDLTVKLHRRWLCWRHTCTGRYLYRRGDLAAARRRFLLAVDAREDACKPHIYLYRIYLYQRRFRMAIDELTRARQIDPRVCCGDVASGPLGAFFSRGFTRRPGKSTISPPESDILQEGLRHSLAVEEGDPGLNPAERGSSSHDEHPKDGVTRRGAASCDARSSDASRSEGDWGRLIRHPGKARGSRSRLGDCRDTFEYDRFRRMGPIRPQEMAPIDWTDLERKLQHDDPPAY